jgi:hypothetical protein
MSPTCPTLFWKVYKRAGFLLIAYNESNMTRSLTFVIEYMTETKFENPCSNIEFILNILCKDKTTVNVKVQL